MRDEARPTSLRSVRHTFAANRVRAALTLLGIMIGAGSIVLLAGLLARRRGGAAPTSRSSANEADLDPRRAATIRRRKQRGQAPAASSSQVDAEVLDDSRACSTAPGRRASATRESRAAAAASARSGCASSASRRSRCRSIGSSVEQGRFIDDDDLRERRRVCVVGQDVWRELLREDAVARRASTSPSRASVAGGRRAQEQAVHRRRSDGHLDVEPQGAGAATPPSTRCYATDARGRAPLRARSAATGALGERLAGGRERRRRRRCCGATSA